MTAIAILQAAVDETGNKAEVARRLGVSRTSVSLLLSGKYPGDTANMYRRINTLLAPERTCPCPYIGGEIKVTECAKISASMPTSSPAALRHWKACRDCAQNPHKKEQ